MSVSVIRWVWSLQRTKTEGLPGRRNSAFRLRSGSRCSINSSLCLQPAGLPCRFWICQPSQLVLFLWETLRTTLVWRTVVTAKDNSRYGSVLLVLGSARWMFKILHDLITQEFEEEQKKIWGDNFMDATLWPFRSLLTFHKNIPDDGFPSPQHSPISGLKLLSSLWFWIVTHYTR